MQRHRARRDLFRPPELARIAQRNCGGEGGLPGQTQKEAVNDDEFRALMASGKITITCPGWMPRGEVSKAPKKKRPPQSAEYREKNRERIREKSRRWYRKNANKVAEKTKKWRQENPDKRKDFRHKRRAKVFGGMPATCSSKIKEMKSKKVGSCSYCGVVMETINLTIDHVIPLSRGGKHSPDNLAFACRSCNSSKGAKMLGAEFQPKIKQRGAQFEMGF